MTPKLLNESYTTACREAGDCSSIRSSEDDAVSSNPIDAEAILTAILPSTKREKQKYNQRFFGYA